jgi:hypothetical protein
MEELGDREEFIAYNRSSLLLDPKKRKKGGDMEE